MEKERNEIEERLNNTKALDELKGRENDLKRLNEEDQKIIQDEKTSQSEREAAEERVANALKYIGSKLGSFLPGLIGSIVKFLFKTAGKAVGFLAEHTWLLILAAVFFIFEKYIKNRR